ncbi:hypothetical protein [Moorena sp. SIO4G3]|uniref:hypothetical protein n=1 Tax=Moorena sp. SIO4G3 TaxID=2607821 RepID=UPI0025CDC3D4|nr:hypothetical protein [Moorena sp. SIO4G3]
MATRSRSTKQPWPLATRSRSTKQPWPLATRSRSTKQPWPLATRSRSTLAFGHAIAFNLQPNNLQPNNLQPNNQTTFNLGLWPRVRVQPSTLNLQNDPNKEPPELCPGGVWCEE